MLEYVVRGYGNGHVTGVIAWLLQATAVALAVILLLSIALDVGWKRTQEVRTD